MPTSFCSSIWSWQSSWTSMSYYHITCSACLRTQSCQREHGRESWVVQERHSDVWCTAWAWELIPWRLCQIWRLKVWLQSSQLCWLSQISFNWPGLTQTWLRLNYYPSVLIDCDSLRWCASLVCTDSHWSHQSLSRPWLCVWLIDFIVWRHASSVKIRKRLINLI